MQLQPKTSFTIHDIAGEVTRCFERIDLVQPYFRQTQRGKINIVQISRC